MWEAIRANKRRSIFLVALMALLLVAAGYFIGEAWGGPGAGFFGVAVAGAIWIVMSLISYFQGGRILMAASGARKVEKGDYPQLYNIVEEMQIASGLSCMPEVYIIETTALNAFATGRDPGHAAVAVTTGLLMKLNREQLQGVIAHEIGHVVNRDILFMTMLSVMLGVLVMISQFFLRSMFYRSMYGGRRRSSSSGGDGRGQAIMLIIGLVFAIVAPILAQLIYFAASRRREYLADATAVVLTRNPSGLAGALEAISGNPNLETASGATAPLFIENPLRRAKKANLWSTHPPIADRIRILRAMGGGAGGYQGYQAALSQVSGDKAGRLPKSVLSPKAS